MEMCDHKVGVRKRQVNGDISQEQTSQATINKGEKADPNPWGATTLEWRTPQTPPGHGNFDELPLVYRWAYDYSVPGYEQDFIPQDVSPAEAEKMAKRVE
jgi:heme/copper-type cytochrome/quinol oxidase subunit 1